MVAGIVLNAVSICKADYRSAFTHCSDCMKDVHMLIPMEDVPEKYKVKELSLAVCPILSGISDQIL